MSQWQEYLENSILSSALADAQKPCKEVASKAIRKRLRSILESGAQIGPQSPDTELHCLRIQAKKLRYLLEFYRSLFPETEMDILVKSLKKLQDNLGNFNDLSVQQKMLGQYQDALALKEHKNAIKVAAALGGLITHLHEEQIDVRNKFEQTFEQFTTVENSKLFKLLFQ
jgi:CHAD domain-containing protein